MNSQQSILGQCPFCASTIPTGWAIIEYETSEGTSVYAECPSCADVVHPESDSPT